MPSSEIHSNVLRRSSNMKQLLHLLKPYIHPAKPQKVVTQTIEKSILTIDELPIVNKYKIGVLYAKSNQKTEEEMFGNEHGSKNFDSFLEVLGNRVDLNSFTGFAAGLDVKNCQTGKQTVATKWRDFEITFHVSTLLPFFPEDSQQIQRKRHIGNDLVCIVFVDGENAQFDPKSIRSQFLHIYIVVTLEINPSFNQQIPIYRVAVTSSSEVAYFGPMLPSPPLFYGREALREFLLAKVINGENAAYKSPKFSKPHIRTRNALIDDLWSTFSDESVKNEKLDDTSSSRLSLLMNMSPTVSISTSSPSRRTSLFVGLSRKVSNSSHKSSASQSAQYNQSTFLSLNVVIPGSPSIETELSLKQDSPTDSNIFSPDILSPSVKSFKTSSSRASQSIPSGYDDDFVETSVNLNLAISLDSLNSKARRLIDHENTDLEKNGTEKIEYAVDVKNENTHSPSVSKGLKSFFGLKAKGKDKSPRDKLHPRLKKEKG
ncbi:GTPase-activating Rap/Ran-GAP domain-like protein 3 [Nowakowskiella sp. JEL0078]|nr:GTPase-activating Rap/Ran-GAP domain-like protein 3 [Nowakowskiella sp. JEL0078]